MELINNVVDSLVFDCFAIYISLGLCLLLWCAPSAVHDALQNGIDELLLDPSALGFITTALAMIIQWKYSILSVPELGFLFYLVGFGLGGLSIPSTICDFRGEYETAGASVTRTILCFLVSLLGQGLMTG